MIGSGQALRPYDALGALFDRSSGICLPVHVRSSPKQDFSPGAESVTATRVTDTTFLR